ncbi:MAG: DUF1569 domain-containing protein [Acidobacteriia bacterium]|nr:DUF1569 domain-containing protein [Terriglobia bacterium]
MSTLADPKARTSCSDRLSRLDPNTRPKWGRMTAHQMVCHLDDSFLVATGDKYASPASNFLTKTVTKWVALRTAFPWPHGVKTRPEIEQGSGGTAPSDWERDCARLRQSILDFAARTTFAAHPIFGEMSQRDWLVWGYRHVDHHLRQFGV